jgi:ankyrin repeat protein
MRFDRATTEVMMVTNPLFQAMGAGDAHRAREVLRSHPELARSRDEDGLSPLMQALYRGFDELAEALRGASGELDLFEAAAVGDLERLREVVDGASAANDWSSDGFTPLHLAAFFGQPEAARFLIRHGADVEAVARNERFAAEAHPLHSAVAAQDHEVVALLLEAGADPNARQHGGFTPLLEAAQLGNDDLVVLLLAHGADRGGRLDDGSAAADLARKAGNMPLADRLEGAPA